MAIAGIYGFHRAAAAALAISLRRSGVERFSASFPAQLGPFALVIWVVWPQLLAVVLDLPSRYAPRREQHTLCLQWVSIRPSVL